MKSVDNQETVANKKKYVFFSDPDNDAGNTETCGSFYGAPDQVTQRVDGLEQRDNPFQRCLKNVQNSSSHYPLQPCPFTFISAVRQKLMPDSESKTLRTRSTPAGMKRFPVDSALLTAGHKIQNRTETEGMDFVMPLKVPDVKICPKTLDKSGRDNGTSKECIGVQREVVSSDRAHERGGVKSVKCSEKAQAQRKLDFSLSDQQPLTGCAGTELSRSPNVSAVLGACKKKEHVRDLSREKENRYKRMKKDDATGLRTDDSQQDASKRSRSPRHFSRKENADSNPQLCTTAAGRAKHPLVCHLPRGNDSASGKSRGKSFATSTAKKDSDKKRRTFNTQYTRLTRDGLNESASKNFTGDSVGECSAAPTAHVVFDDNSGEFSLSDAEHKRTSDPFLLQLLSDPNRACPMERRRCRYQSKFPYYEEDRSGSASTRQQVKKVPDRFRGGCAVEYEAGQRCSNHEVSVNADGAFDLNLVTKERSSSCLHPAASHLTQRNVSEVSPQHFQDADSTKSSEEADHLGKHQPSVGEGYAKNDDGGDDGLISPCITSGQSIANGDTEELNDNSLPEALLDPTKISFRDVAYKPEEFAALLTPDVNLMFRAKRRKQIIERNSPDVDATGLLYRSCVPETVQAEDARLLHPTALHMQFQAELHLLDSFDESLRQVMNVEKSLCGAKQQQRDELPRKHNPRNDALVERSKVTKDCAKGKGALAEKKMGSVAGESPDCGKADESNGGTRHDGRITVNEVQSSGGIVDRDTEAVLVKACKPTMRVAEVQTQTVNDIGTQTDVDASSSIVPRRFQEEVRGITYRRGSFMEDDLQQLSFETIDQYEENLDQMEEVSLPSKMRTMSEISLHETTSSIKTETGTEISISTRDLTCSFNRYLDLEIAQLIKDEKQRYDKIEMLFKSREKTLHDRTKKLVKLEEQKRALRDTGQDSRISSVKKKQRALLLKLQQEKDEMNRLKELHKIASQERKVMLQKQRNMFNPQMSTKNILTKLKRSADNQSPRRLSGPMKGYDIRSNSSMSSLVDSDKSQQDRSQHEISALGEMNAQMSPRGKGDCERSSRDHDAFSQGDDIKTTSMGTMGIELRGKYLSVPPIEGESFAVCELKSRKYEEKMPRADGLKVKSQRNDFEPKWPSVETGGGPAYIRRGDSVDVLRLPHEDALQVTGDSIKSESETPVSGSSRRSKLPADERDGHPRRVTSPTEGPEEKDITPVSADTLMQDGLLKKAESSECPDELFDASEQDRFRADKEGTAGTELPVERVQYGVDCKAITRRKSNRCQKPTAPLNVQTVSTVPSGDKSNAPVTKVVDDYYDMKRTEADNDCPRANCRRGGNPSFNDIDLSESQSSLRALLMHSSAVQQRNSKLLRDIAYDRMSTELSGPRARAAKEPETREHVRPRSSRSNAHGHAADNPSIRSRVKAFTLPHGSSADNERGLSKSIVIREHLPDYKNTKKFKQVLSAREAALVSRKNCVEEWMAWHARLSEEENRVAKMEEAALKLVSATSDVCAYQDTTVSSDTSDVEGRIELLAGKLAERRMEMSRLKKEARKRAKQRLRALETNLLNQIKKYDTTIHEMRKKLEARRGGVDGMESDRLAIECKSLADFKIPDMPTRRIEEICGGRDLLRSKSESDLLSTGGGTRKKDVAPSLAIYAADWKESTSTTPTRPIERSSRLLPDRAPSRKNVYGPEAVVISYRDGSIGAALVDDGVCDKSCKEAGQIISSLPTSGDGRNKVNRILTASTETPASNVSDGQISDSATAPARTFRDNGTSHTDGHSISSSPTSLSQSESSNASQTGNFLREVDATVVEGTGSEMRVLSTNMDFLQINNKNLNEDIASLENELNVLSKMLRLSKSTNDGRGESDLGSMKDNDRGGGVIASKNGDTSKAISETSLNLETIVSSDDFAEDTRTAQSAAVMHLHERMRDISDNANTSLRAGNDASECKTDVEHGTVISEDISSPMSNQEIDYKARSKEILNEIEKSIISEHIKSPQRDTSTAGIDTAESSGRTSHALSEAVTDVLADSSKVDNEPASKAVSTALQSDHYTEATTTWNVSEAFDNLDCSALKCVETSASASASAWGEMGEDSPKVAPYTVRDPPSVGCYTETWNDSVTKDIVEQTSFSGGVRAVGIGSTEESLLLDKFKDEDEDGDAEGCLVVSNMLKMSSVGDVSVYRDSPGSRLAASESSGSSGIPRAASEQRNVGSVAHERIEEVTNVERGSTEDIPSVLTDGSCGGGGGGGGGGGDSNSDEGSASDGAHHDKSTDFQLQGNGGFRDVTHRMAELMMSIDPTDQSPAGESNARSSPEGSRIANDLNGVDDCRKVKMVNVPFALTVNEIASARERASNGSGIDGEITGDDRGARLIAEQGVTDIVPEYTESADVVADLDSTAEEMIGAGLADIGKFAEQSTVTSPSSDESNLQEEFENETRGLREEGPIYEDISDASLRVLDEPDTDDGSRGSQPDKYEAVRESGEDLRMVEDLPKKSQGIETPTNRIYELNCLEAGRSSESFTGSQTSGVCDAKLPFTAPRDDDSRNGDDDDDDDDDDDSDDDGDDDGDGDLPKSSCAQLHERLPFPVERRADECVSGVAEGGQETREETRPDFSERSSRVDGVGNGEGGVVDGNENDSPRDPSDSRLDVETLDDDLLSEENAESDNVDVKADTSEKDIEIMIGKLKASLEQPGLEVAEFEAKLLRIKQLEIELEIKKLEAEQVSYYVREIPNKPPPPYTPPGGGERLLTSVDGLSPPPVAAVIPTNVDELTAFTEKVTTVIYRAKQAGIDIVEMEAPNEIYDEPRTDKQGSESTSMTRRIYDTFLFDLCKEIVVEIYRSEYEEPGPSWTKPNVKTKPAIKIPRGLDELNEYVAKEVAALFGFKTKLQRENMVMRWSRKRRDRVDELLAREAQAEEDEWTKFHYDELAVKNGLTVAILDSLITETSSVVRMAYAKKRKTLV